MSDEFAIPESFDGTTRLFPLPNVVLFPQVMLPLHIFEPRYRQMTADALAGDQLITMALLKPGFEAEYEHRPPLHAVACLGKVVADQRLEDGRYNILLRGLSRVRILKELEADKLYRTARVELLEDNALNADQAPEIRDELSKHVASWLTTLGLATDQVMKLLDSDLPSGVLSDILSFALPLTVEFRQELLEELDANRRLRSLVAYLAANEPPKAKDGGARKFPPEFSSN